MNNFQRRATTRIAPAILLATALIAQPSRAALLSLTDGNSSVSLDTSSQAGVYNWTVDGQNQLNQQWFWYRIGNTAEASIDTIGGASFVQVSPNLLMTTYVNSTFRVQVRYTLQGGDLGSGTSSLVVQIAVQNFTQNPLDLHFFQYSDFEPGGSPNNTIQFGQDVNGLYNEALATSANGSVSIDTGVASSANHSEAAILPTTLTKLNDGSATTLTDTVAAGPGNITWGLQWDRVLSPSGQPGSSFTFSAATTVISRVPDVTGAWPMFLGLAACCMMRRIFPKRS